MNGFVDEQSIGIVMYMMYCTGEYSVLVGTPYSISTYGVTKFHPSFSSALRSTEKIKNRFVPPMLERSLLLSNFHSHFRPFLDFPLWFLKLSYVSFHRFPLGRLKHKLKKKGETRNEADSIINRKHPGLYV